MHPVCVDPSEAKTCSFCHGKGKLAVPYSDMQRGFHIVDCHLCDDGLLRWVYPHNGELIWSKNPFK
jgi:hypothetical protein